MKVAWPLHIIGLDRSKYIIYFRIQVKSVLVNLASLVESHSMNATVTAHHPPLHYKRGKTLKAWLIPELVPKPRSSSFTAFSSDHTKVGGCLIYFEVYNFRSCLSVIPPTTTKKMEEEQQIISTKTSGKTIRYINIPLGGKSSCRTSYTWLYLRDSRTHE